MKGRRWEGGRRGEGKERENRREKGVQGINKSELRAKQEGRDGRGRGRMKGKVVSHNSSTAVPSAHACIHKYGLIYRGPRL